MGCCESNPVPQYGMIYPPQQQGMLPNFLELEENGRQAQAFQQRQALQLEQDKQAGRQRRDHEPIGLSNLQSYKTNNYIKEFTVASEADELSYSPLNAAHQNHRCS